MGHSAYSMLFKMMVASGVAAAVPVGAMAVFDTHPVSVMVRGAVGAATQDARSAALSAVPELSQRKGLMAMLGASPEQVGEPAASDAPVYGELKTYTPRDGMGAARGGIDDLSLAGRVQGAAAAILAWPDGRTFIVKAGQELAPLRARVAEISAEGVVLEQRTLTEDGEPYIRVVQLRDAEAVSAR